MKGYKGMSKDMTCQGMKFEIGKTYHVDGDISVCRNGLHFCEKLIDVLNFYDINDGSRYFEVEAGGKIKKDEIKCVASSLTIIREIHTIELNRAIYDPGYGSGYGYGDDIYGDGYGNGMFFYTSCCGNRMYSVDNNPMKYHGCLCPRCFWHNKLVTLYLRGTPDGIRVFENEHVVKDESEGN